MVIMCVGFRPNTELLKDKVDMLPNGAIEVNEYMQTSNPDIFAAGDSAVVHYNPSQTKNYIPLATNAVRQGMLVGRNLTEQNWLIVAHRELLVYIYSVGKLVQQV